MSKQPRKKWWGVMHVDIRTTLLVLLSAMWPLITLGRSGALEIAAKEEARGWMVDSQNFAGDHGYGVAFDYGNFVAYAYRPVSAPKVISNALVEASAGRGVVTDTSGWLGSAMWQLGIGRTLSGRANEPRWREFDGMAFPVWPVSLVAGVMLCGVLYRKYQARDVPGRTLCGVCSYDLRMHQAGERCPECGTVVGEVAADLA